MSSVKVLKEMSPSTTQDNMCAVCGKFIKFTAGFSRTVCGHNMHTSCMVNLIHHTRDDGETRCSHCNTVIMMYNDPVQGEEELTTTTTMMNTDCAACESGQSSVSGSNDDLSEGGGSLSNDESPKSKFDPFSAAQQRSVLGDRNNSVSRAFALEHDIEWLRTRDRPLARTFADLCNLGLSASHLAVEVNGRKLAPLDQLLDYGTADQPVTLKHLEVKLGLTLNDVLKLNPTEKQLARLGVDMAYENATDAAGSAGKDKEDDEAPPRIPKRTPPTKEQLDASLEAEKKFRAVIAERFKNRASNVKVATFIRDGEEQRYQVVVPGEFDTTDGHDSEGDDYDEHADGQADDNVQQQAVLVQGYESDEELYGDDYADQEYEEVAPVVMVRASTPKQQQRPVFAKGFDPSQAMAAPAMAAPAMAAPAATSQEVEARAHQLLRERLASAPYSEAQSAQTRPINGQIDLATFKRHLAKVQI